MPHQTWYYPETDAPVAPAPTDRAYASQGYIKDVTAQVKKERVMLAKKVADMLTYDVQAEPLDNAPAVAKLVKAVLNTRVLDGQPVFYMFKRTNVDRLYEGRLFGNTIECKCSLCAARNSKYDRLFNISNYEKHIGSGNHYPSEKTELANLSMTLQDFALLVACDPIDNTPWKCVLCNGKSFEETGSILVCDACEDFAAHEECLRSRHMPLNENGSDELLCNSCFERMNKEGFIEYHPPMDGSVPGDAGDNSQVAAAAQRQGRCESKKPALRIGQFVKTEATAESQHEGFRNAQLAGSGVAADVAGPSHVEVQAAAHSSGGLRVDLEATMLQHTQPPSMAARKRVAGDAQCNVNTDASGSAAAPPRSPVTPDASQYRVHHHQGCGNPGKAAADPPAQKRSRCAAAAEPPAGAARLGPVIQPGSDTAAQGLLAQQQQQQEQQQLDDGLVVLEDADVVKFMRTVYSGIIDFHRNMHHRLNEAEKEAQEAKKQLGELKGSLKDLAMQ